MSRARARRIGRDFATAYLGKASPADERASPLFADLSGLPPMFLQVGDTELLLDDARRVHERVMAAGGASIFESWPHVFHVWQMLDGLVPEARAALKRAADFIKLQLRETRGYPREPQSGSSHQRIRDDAEQLTLPSG